MTTSSTRRTLTGLAPRTSSESPSDKGLGRLIRANREEVATEVSISEPKRSNETFKQAKSVTNRVPKYLMLKRREARVYEEQADALTLLARRINAGRRLQDGTMTGERITDNTLLRVAIDLLLERSEELRGTTEAEIAANLGLRPRTVEDN